MPLRNLNVICLPSFETFQDCASSGSSTCDCRFILTRVPPVRYRIATEASSSTWSGSNVFGSERRQNRSSPWANAEGVSRPRHRHRTRLGSTLVDVNFVIIDPGLNSEFFFLFRNDQLKTCDYGHQQNKRHKLPRFLANRDETLELFQQASP